MCILLNHTSASQWTSGRKRQSRKLGIFYYGILDVENTCEALLSPIEADVSVYTAR